MHLHMNPCYKTMTAAQLRALLDRFDTSGEVLHEGRNRIRAFRTESGEELVVKRYKRPNAMQRFIYTFFRKSKARRAYEHALRLRELGFDTPEPIAYGTDRHRGLFAEGWLVTRRSSLRSVAEELRAAPSAGQELFIDAFARYVIRLHEAGVEHRDFNLGNILYARDDAGWHFQLIDINRMRFFGRPLTPRRCMVNLRRLNCPAEPFLKLLHRYAALRDWDIDQTILRGSLFRLLLARRQEIKHRFRTTARRRAEASGAAARTASERSGAKKRATK